MPDDRHEMSTPGENDEFERFERLTNKNALESSQVCVYAERQKRDAMPRD